MRNWILGTGLLLAAIGGSVLLWRGHSDSTQSFQTMLLRTGTIRNTVSTTGTLSALETVEVGAQVSGTLTSIPITDNQRVRKGQLLATLEKTLFVASVRDADAQVRSAAAKAEQARADYIRYSSLYHQGLLSAGEYTVYKTNLDAAEAALISAESTLQRARINLGYAEIRAPIDGTVIEKAVEAGQTVASSFQTPKLFVLAADLTKMQIKAYVDESDIGQIKVGQRARFIVQAFPDDEFTGNLDTLTSLEIMALFQDLNDHGLTILILIVTHEPDISQYAKRIVTMRDGRRVRDEPVIERRQAREDAQAFASSGAVRSAVDGLTG